MLITPPRSCKRSNNQKCLAWNLHRAFLRVSLSISSVFGNEKRNYNLTVVSQLTCRTERSSEALYSMRDPTLQQGEYSLAVVNDSISFIFTFKNQHESQISGEWKFTFLKKSTNVVNRTTMSKEKVDTRN